MKFGTYTRDSFTGLDYADQRFYASSYGRFNTADPYRASAGAGDPGSWNRYAYVGGDPVNVADPSGLAGCPADYQTSVTFGNITYVTTTSYICNQLPMQYLTIFGSDGWNLKTHSTHYIGNQGQYESGACTTRDGLACYEEDRVLSSLLDGVQTVFDIAGLAPGAGEVFDLANAVLSAARGNGADAVLSLAAMIPVGGQAAVGIKSLRRAMVAQLGEEAAKGMHAHHILPQQFRKEYGPEEY